MRRNLGAFLGYLGAAISAGAYVYYAVYLLQGDIETNVITWWLWGAETVLGLSIYRVQVKGDFAKYVEELVASIGCCTIAAMLLGRALLANADVFAPLRWSDFVSAGLVIGVYILYRRIKDDDVWYATVAFQVILVFSSLPLVRSAWENPGGEPALPWIGWTAGFALQLACVYLRMEQAKGYRALVTPANYLLWHSIVAAVVYFYAP